MKLLLFPLKPELDFFKQHLTQHGQVGTVYNTGKLNVFEYKKLEWRLAVAGHGKVQFAVTTDFLINHFNDLEAVLCIGSAGGLSSNVKIGDIVIGEKTIEHDFNTKLIKINLPQFFANKAILDKLKLSVENMSKKNFNSKSRIHFAAIASGDEDVVDSTRANEIFLKTEAHAVAWEGAGGARASAFNNMPYIEIRGITDLASSKTHKDFAIHLKPTMENLCEFLLGNY